MLNDVDDPISIIQVFAERWRTGKIAPRGEPVRSRTVENALRAIGQTMASVGAQDLRYNASGKIEYRLQQQLKGYKRSDPPPSRVKPIPFTLVNHVNLVANLSTDPLSLATADLATLAFSSFSVPANTRNHNKARTHNHFASWTSNSNLAMNLIPRPRLTSAQSDWQPSPYSPSLDKRTARKGKLSATPAVVTRIPVQ